MKKATIGELRDHLSRYLEHVRGLPASLTFVTLDRQQGEAAEREGFTCSVLNSAGEAATFSVPRARIIRVPLHL